MSVGYPWILIILSCSAINVLVKKNTYLHLQPQTWLQTLLQVPQDCGWQLK